MSKAAVGRIKTIVEDLSNKNLDSPASMVLELWSFACNWETASAFASVPGCCTILDFCDASTAQGALFWADSHLREVFWGTLWTFSSLRVPPIDPETVARALGRPADIPGKERFSQIARCPKLGWVHSLVASRGDVPLLIRQHLKVLVDYAAATTEIPSFRRRVCAIICCAFRHEEQIGGVPKECSDSEDRQMERSKVEARRQEIGRLLCSFFESVFWEIKDPPEDADIDVDIYANVDPSLLMFGIKLLAELAFRDRTILPLVQAERWAVDAIEWSLAMLRSDVAPKKRKAKTEDNQMRGTQCQCSRRRFREHFDWRVCAMVRTLKEMNARI